jgi:hypothetical protein
LTRFVIGRRLVCALAMSALAAPLQAGDATVPGDATSPYPTIVNLAVEWRIEGDDNLNAAATVRYRAAGEAAWREAMPLRRVPAGKSAETMPIFSWDNKLSGSILDLRPDTDYEIELRLTDPDGGQGEKTLKARTRPVPKAPADAPVRNVNPETIGDLQPGEIGLLADGDYGDFVAPTDGEPGKPVVYRAAGPGARFSSVSLRGRKHVYLEGVTIRRLQDRKAAVDLLGASDCVVRRCDIEAIFGVRAAGKPGATNCYVADNTIKGATPWTNEAMGASRKNVGEGIEMTGSGNVICFNRVSNFRDCISTMEDEYTADQYCIDIYNNDITVGADDGIEADFCMSNCRIMRNRLTNCFVGLSSQPGLGGPTYFVRNVMYNLTYVPFKLHRWSRGDVILHNTVVKPGDGMACFSGREFDHALFRNNLCIGGPPGDKPWGGYGGGVGNAITLQNIGDHCDIDHDALGTWNTPFKGRIGKQTFASPEEMRKGPHETHGIAIGLDVFDGVAFPEKPETLYDPPDLRPREGAAVVDAAQPLANVNDAFAGQGPDIGAYEVGQPLPTYGPRPEGVDESTSRP